MSYLYDVMIAILKQAARDYIQALKKNNFHKIKELEDFFLSDYGQAMSYNNGEEIMKRCKQIVMKKRKAERNDLQNRSGGTMSPHKSDRSE